MLPPFDPVAIPDPGDVEAVLFLVGDAGATDADRSPLLRRLREDVEGWSAALARDSAVAILFLGDNVYPTGLRDSSEPGFAADTARLWNQIRLVTGPAAAEHETAGWFLAGNHDWGGMIGDDGVARLRNQEVALARARRTGPNVTLLPAAGTPGPAIRDIGDDVRLIFIDTPWFLQDPPEAEQAAFFAHLEDAMRAAGGRDVIVTAHHPWTTSGPHGVSEGGRGLGLYFLLEKSGTLVQDLNSPMYRDFIRRFRETVEDVGWPPLIFAAGHDHSLQVFVGRLDTDPPHILVSGAGSKLTPVSDADGLRFAASRPGYMTLVIGEAGEIDLFVMAGDADRLLCPGGEPERSRCMREGVAAFETVYSAVMREGAGRDAGQ